MLSTRKELFSLALNEKTAAKLSITWHLTKTKISNVFHHSSAHPTHPRTLPAPNRVFIRLSHHNALNLIKSLSSYLFEY